MRSLWGTSAGGKAGLRGRAQAKGGASGEPWRERACASTRGVGKGAGLPEAETANGQDPLRSGGWGPLGIEVGGKEREGLL